LSGLALADRTFGEIESAMRESGAWDRSTIILTSDHHLRSRLKGGSRSGRVPLLIHMPGQTRGITVEREFRTTILSRVVPGILSGSLRNPEDVERVLF
jgi:arylsulfatase A-like enzyme